MTETQALAPIRQQELTVADLRRRQELIQTAIKEVMVDGHHYGQIPGTDKKSLLKPGAEKLCSLFMLSPSFSYHERDLPEGHREYRVDCTLTHITSGIVAGSAAGSCSTMESKYRWRLASRKCPKCGADAIRKGKAEYGGGWYCSDRHGGCKANFAEGDKSIIGQDLGRVPNPDIADQYNTVLKMATKRALVAATLVVTAASDALIPEEDEDDDEGDKKAQRGGKKPETQKKQEPRQQQRTEAPVDESKLTPKQELARDCAKFASDLGLTGDEVARALKENGIENFKRWSDLDEGQLLKFRAMLLKQLNAGTTPAA